MTFPGTNNHCNAFQVSYLSLRTKEIKTNSQTMTMAIILYKKPIVKHNHNFEFLTDSNMHH